MKKLFRGFAIAVISTAVFTVQSMAECPSGLSIEKKLKEVFRGFSTSPKVEAVKETPFGLCQFVIGEGLNKRVLYVTKDGRYLIVGRVIDLEEKKNVTSREEAKAARLTEDQVRELEKYVAFSEGRGKYTLYLITDPDCPYCKRLEKDLKELIKEGLVTIKVVFFPLKQLHPNAEKRAVSIICDRKGLDEVLSDYSSDNQCEEGKKKVQNSVFHLIKLGVRGTPVIIFEDGRVFQGWLPKEDLKKLLGKKA